jgi:hypothetical protein
MGGANVTVSLTKYVDRLPIPSVLRPVRKSKRATYYRVLMRQVLQQLPLGFGDR